MDVHLATKNLKFFEEALRFLPLPNHTFKPAHERVSLSPTSHYDNPLKVASDYAQEAFNQLQQPVAVYITFLVTDKRKSTFTFEQVIGFLDEKLEEPWVLESYEYGRIHSSYDPTKTQKISGYLIPNDEIHPIAQMSKRELEKYQQKRYKRSCFADFFKWLSNNR